MTGPLSRRRASSGRVRGLAHLVPLLDLIPHGPAGPRLASTALCGFTPKRHWARVDAPAWEDTCERCTEKAER